MHPLATTPCPTCGASVAFDPALAGVAACPACGGRVDTSATTPATAGRARITVNGRPVHAIDFRPSPLVVLAALVAVAAGVVLAVVFAVIAAGAAVAVAAILVVAAGVGRVRRAVGGGRTEGHARIRA